jgi:hypothetical protein
MRKILNVIASGKSGKRNNPVIVVGSEAVFSNGMPTSCGFVNGFYCPKCKVVTEHVEKAGRRKCTGCGGAKAFLISALPVEREELEAFKRHKHEVYAFFAAIRVYSVRVEVDALAPLLKRKSLSYNRYLRLKRNFPSHEFEVED